MSITQTPAPNELTVTAHATLAEPLITISGLDVVLTPREATSLSEQLAAACADIGRRRPRRRPARRIGEPGGVLPAAAQ